MVHHQVLYGDPVALQLALDELREGPDAGLGDRCRFAAQLGEVDSYVGRRTPEVASEGRGVPESVRLLHGDEVHQRLAYGEEVQGCPG